MKVRDERNSVSIQSRGSDLQDDRIAFLLLLLLFIVQPVLLAIGGRKAYHRSATLWGFLAFGINAGILVFFESQLRSQSLADGVDEVITIMMLSAMLILAI